MDVRCSVRAVTILPESIRCVKDYCNPELEVAGILFTQFDNISNNSATMTDIVMSLKDYLQIPVFESKIRKSVVVPSARTARLSVCDYSATLRRRAPVAEDIAFFILEYLDARAREYSRKVANVSG